VPRFRLHPGLRRQAQQNRPPCAASTPAAVLFRTFLASQAHSKSRDELFLRRDAKVVAGPEDRDGAQTNRIGRRRQRMVGRGGHLVLSPVPDEVCAGRLCRGEGETEPKQIESEQGIALQIGLFQRLLSQLGRNRAKAGSYRLAPGLCRRIIGCPVPEGCSDRPRG
jgi:hypothetical protein